MKTKDFEEIKSGIEDVEILNEEWEKNFKLLQEKSVLDNVSYLKLVNYCFDNLRKIKLHFSNDNLNKYLITIKINKIRELLIEYEQSVQPSNHYILLRINDYVRDNRQNFDLLIDYFVQIFSGAGSGKI